MSDFVETLKRLYKLGKVTEAKISSLYSQEKITQEEEEYILESWS